MPGFLKARAVAFLMFPFVVVFTQGETPGYIATLLMAIISYAITQWSTSFPPPTIRHVFVSLIICLILISIWSILFVAGNSVRSLLMFSVYFFAYSAFALGHLLLLRRRSARANANQ